MIGKTLFSSAHNISPLMLVNYCVLHCTHCAESVLEGDVSTFELAFLCIVDCLLSVQYDVECVSYCRNLLLHSSPS